jgi:hypothetical protein
MRTPGRTARSASEIPDASPPPPIGITNVVASGTCSASSRPIVPCPAITSGSSNGCTNVAPVSSTYPRAESRHSSSAGPVSSISAPYARVASTFAIGASCGMKMRARAPTSRAAHATACPWLPALAATTPAARSASLSREMRLYAPRTLNEPVRCRFSAFRCTSRPARRDSVSDR